MIPAHLIIGDEDIEMREDEFVGAGGRASLHLAKYQGMTVCVKVRTGRGCEGVPSWSSVFAGCQPEWCPLFIGCDGLSPAATSCTPCRCCGETRRRQPLDLPEGQRKL
jgi:hypothetical protein